eukprot:gene34840-40949_t
MRSGRRHRRLAHRCRCLVQGLAHAVLAAAKLGFRAGVDADLRLYRVRCDHRLERGIGRAHALDPRNALRRQWNPEH